MAQAPLTSSASGFDAPSAARIYDYLLGGFHHFEADRQVGEKLLEFYPDMRLNAYAHRAFLRRVINFMLDQGIDQFLDIGSGLPTVGNVHELVQAANPMASVVYVDVDPVAVAHARTLLSKEPFAVAIEGDLSTPEVILANKEVQTLIDFERPLGLTLVAVLHYLQNDDEANQAVQRLRDALAPGSYMAIVHVALEVVNPGHDSRRAYLGPVGKSKPRSKEQVERFLEGFQLLDPGIVYTPQWRPEGPEELFADEPQRVFTWAGLGRKDA